MEYCWNLCSRGFLFLLLHLLPSSSSLWVFWSMWCLAAMFIVHSKHIITIIMVSGKKKRSETRAECGHATNRCWDFSFLWRVCIAPGLQLIFSITKWRTKLHSALVLFVVEIAAFEIKWEWGGGDIVHRQTNDIHTHQHLWLHQKLKDPVTSWSSMCVSKSNLVLSGTAQLYGFCYSHWDMNVVQKARSKQTMLNWLWKKHFSIILIRFKYYLPRGGGNLPQQRSTHTHCAKCHNEYCFLHVITYLQTKEKWERK